jgi:hypothetical protein
MPLMQAAPSAMSRSEVQMIAPFPRALATVQLESAARQQAPSHPQGSVALTTTAE